MKRVARFSASWPPVWVRDLSKFLRWVGLGNGGVPGEDGNACARRGMVQMTWVAIAFARNTKP
jgi:hypothetical protein